MSEARTTLENQDLQIEISSHGSELVRIYDKNHQREVLWEGKPEVWGRHAPILFPFIGKCADGTYRHEGKAYPMTAHGFARDSEFTLMSKTEGEVWYSLTDTEKTRMVYPFPFRLESGHRLEDNKIRVMWRVENTGDKDLYFMLGGHPAFRTPRGLTVHDFILDFHQEGPLHYQAPNEDGYQEDALSGLLALDEGKAPVVPGFFEHTLTYIFDQGQVKDVSLLLPGGVPYVTVHCSRVPYVGVWTIEKTHPFVCLEPWFGRCDKAGYCGELHDREGEMRLAPGQEFIADYVIEIHKEA